MNAVYRNALLGGILLVLCACSTSDSTGFHLRGLAGAKPLENSMVFISAEGESAFASELEQQLRLMGATLGTTEPTAIRIDISELTESRRVSGYSATRSVSEFTYQLQLNFTLTDGATERTKSDTLFQSASQAYDSDYVLGTQEEAEQIKHDLRKEAARLVALRVSAFKASLTSLAR